VVPPKTLNNLASKQEKRKFVSFQQLKEQDSETLIAPGQIIITARVTIEFEMTK
jgi:hypothetical protein